MTTSPRAITGKTVTVAVPVTLYVTVALPDGAPASQLTAEAVALNAAEHFAHVSHAEISAFNEVNRVHPLAAGTVQAVVAAVAPPRRAAA
ncbi:hypothetical protein [Azospirillum sp. sgz302134]